MKITLTKKRYILWTTIFALATGWGVYGCIQWLFPTHYFSWYPAIPLCFYVFELYYIYMFDVCRRLAPHRLLSVYMGMKFVKMMLSIVFILAYAFLVKVQKEDFLLTSFLFYMFTLLHETIFFYWFEENLKKKKEKRK